MPTWQVVCNLHLPAVKNIKYLVIEKKNSIFGKSSIFNLRIFFITLNKFFFKKIKNIYLGSLLVNSLFLVLWTFWYFDLASLYCWWKDVWISGYLGSKNDRYGKFCEFKVCFFFFFSKKILRKGEKKMMESGVGQLHNKHVDDLANEDR